MGTMVSMWNIVAFYDIFMHNNRLNWKYLLIMDYDEIKDKLSFL